MIANYDVDWYNLMFVNQSRDKREKNDQINDSTDSIYWQNKQFCSFPYLFILSLPGKMELSIG